MQVREFPGKLFLILNDKTNYVPHLILYTTLMCYLNRNLKHEMLLVRYYSDLSHFLIVDQKRGTESNRFQKSFYSRNPNAIRK